MKEFFLEKKKGNGPYFGSGSYAGAFMLEKGTEWYTCRERFENAAAHSKGSSIFFGHPAGKSEDVAAFIHKTEDILGLSNENMCRFALTTSNSILFVVVSDFWWKSSIRRSLFTIFLRAGMAYDRSKDNYEAALLSQDYVKRTQQAVMRFLLGFTEVKAQGGHWVNQFSAIKSEKQLRDMFTSPEKVELKTGIKTIFTS